MESITIMIAEAFRAVFGIKTYEKEYQFSVEIFKPVMDRIFKNLSSSDVEEGGKFLGKIYENGNQISVSIYTYIDVGPKASNSPTHVMPDGNHQEYLFRLIENYDSEIEHVGSWHSHHSNGYQNLSNGDMETYVYNVNDRNYNLDWFFVMLVTRLKKQSVEAKYYLFHRDDERVYVIPQEYIKETNNNYKYENILHEVEHSTYSDRNQRPKFRAEFVRDHHAKDEEYMMNKIRLDDKNWFRDNYPSARMYQSKKDSSINWRWSISTNKGVMEIKYIYPENANKSLGNAMLVIKRGETEVSHINIELNEYRFRKIKEEIEKTYEVF